MDIAEFARHAQTDPAISGFLKDVSDRVRKEHGAPPGTQTMMDIPAEWMPYLIPLLYLAMPWIKMGLKWMAIKQAEIEKRLNDRARELGLNQDAIDKSSGILLKQLIQSSGNEDLEKKLKAIVGEMDDEDLKM